MASGRPVGELQPRQPRIKPARLAQRIMRALFDDPAAWTGKPVVTGERVMRLAAAEDKEIEAWVALGDAIPLPPGAKLRMVVRDASETTRGRLDRQGAALARLGRIESLAFGEDVAGGAAQIVVDEATFILPLEGVIDIAAEKTRLEKALAAAAKERDSLGGRLSNPAFVEKAKPEAVAKAREDHAEKTAEAERLKAALDRLG